MAAVSGHIKLVARKRGDVWYLKYRTPSGKQLERKLGSAWKERSRPPAGHYTRKLAEAELASLLTDLRRGDVPDPGARSGKTFADAAAEWLRYCEEDRDLEQTTLADYGRTAKALEEEFGAETALETIDGDLVEGYRSRMLAGEVLNRRRVVDGGEDSKPIGRRTAQKRMVLLGGIFRRAKRLKWIPVDPTADVEAISLKVSGDFNVLSVQQVDVVARACSDEMFAAAVIVAAYTGLRTGELRALRWRDIDFAGATVHVRSNKPAGGDEKAPKSYKVRSVPLMDLAAKALDFLSRREAFTQPADRVFASEVGETLDQDAFRDALYVAMEVAGIDRNAFPAHSGFTFHDLRHTFGTLAVQAWPISDVQAFMGHADIQTTMRYVHHTPKTGAARQFTEVIERLREADELLSGGGETVSRNVSRTPEIHA